MAEVSPSSPSKRARRESFGLVARPPQLLPLTTADLALPEIGYYIQSTPYPYEAGPEYNPSGNFGTSVSSRDRMEYNLQQMVQGLPIQWGYEIGTQQLLSIWVGWLPRPGNPPFKSEDIPPLVIRLEHVIPHVPVSYHITMFAQLPNKPWAPDIPRRVTSAFFGSGLGNYGMAHSPLTVPMTVSVKTIMNILDFMAGQLLQRVETRRAIASEAREALVTDVVGEIAGFLPYNRCRFQHNPPSKRRRLSVYAAR